MLYDGRVVTVMEGDAEHAELLRGIRGGGASTFGVVVRMYIRMYPESRVEAFFLGGPTARVSGLRGAREIEDFASNIPPNISFFFSQTVDSDGSTETLLYAACHGWGPTCRGALRRLRLSGTFRSYSSHYEYMTRVLGKERQPSPRAAYFASMAIPMSSIQGGSKNALSYMQRFISTVPRGGNFATGVCTLRPIGGAAARNDPDGELTSVSTQFRQASLYAVCRAAWEGAPPAGATDWVDAFYERYMRPVGTPDGWQYANEGSHNMPGWQQRYWNGQSGYDRMVAAKLKYDPLSVSTGWHMPGTEGSVVMQDAYFCPASCRSQQVGCTNIPESRTCAPRPEHVSRPGSAQPGPNDCKALACSHSITVELVVPDAGSRLAPPGFWLMMMPPGPSTTARCGPVRSQPELLKTFRLSPEASGTQTVTVDKICAGALYQIGVFFERDGVASDSDRDNFTLYYDDNRIAGGTDSHSVFTFTAPEGSV